MRQYTPTRHALGAALAALLLVVPAFAAHRAPQPAGPPSAVKNVRPPVRQQPQPQPMRPAAKSGSAQQPHLEQWIEKHSNLSLADQQKALENEPGFRDLPAQTQQRYRDRLAQLNNMTPQQRSQLLQRNEILESRTPEQREQFRQGMQQYNSLPPGRKLLFKRAFRDLREMPPAQRQQVINSAPFRSQFTDQERGALANVLAVEPYPPLGGQTQGP
jgi:hypothetical protein